MDAAATIARILTSTQAGQVLPRASYRAEYHRLVRALHPDMCALSGAAEAVSRLNAYVAQLAALDTPTDDAGRLRVLPDHRVRFESDPALLRRSVVNHQRLLALRDSASAHFRQYLPAAFAWEGPALLLTPPARVVLLAGLVLPPEHVAWVLSRLLELTAWLHQSGFVHVGLVPEALALVPEFGRELPAELTAYLDTFAPVEDVDFDTVGNPLRLYGLGRLGVRQPGYNWNPVTQEVIAGWPTSFFLLGDEGGDPVLPDLDQPELGIQKLWHGEGDWEVGNAVADTLGQFLLCSAALHHALTAFEQPPIPDDERGFNLAPRAAAWLFPRLKSWAGPYYAAWCASVDNA